MNETHTQRNNSRPFGRAEASGLCLKEALQMIEKGEEMAEIIMYPWLSQWWMRVAIRCHAPDG